jgi:hypothetical protein
MTKDQVLSAAMGLEASERDEVAEALFLSIKPGALASEKPEAVPRENKVLDCDQAQLIPGESDMVGSRRRIQQ